MENASKALIIAGAILLAILIITLGLIVYNQAQSTVSKINMTEQEIAQFNSKFSPYVGTNVTGVNVNALINSVITSNQAAVKDMNGQYVTIAFPTMSDASGGTYVTVGVDASGTNPKIVYGTTDATSASNVATGEQDNTDSILRVTAGKTYTVETYEDPTTGLTSKILVKLNK